MRIKLRTRCGCEKQIDIDARSPTQQLEIYLPLQDYFQSVTSEGFKPPPTTEARTFEFYGFEDMPLYVERSDK